MVKVFSNGQMAESMKETMFKIKNMVLAEWSGQTEKYIRANGNKECNMVKENIKVETEFGDKGTGKMGRESDDQFC